MRFELAARKLEQRGPWRLVSAALPPARTGCRVRDGRIACRSMLAQSDLTVIVTG